MSKKAADVRNLNDAQLMEKAATLRHELFTLRLNSSTAHIKDYSQFKKLRRDIARVTTIIQQRVQQNIEDALGI